MEVNSPNSKPLTSEELAHLENLKSVVETALEDGKFSTYEIERIKSIMRADGKVTYEELRTVHQTTKDVMGDVVPEMEWQANV